MGPRPISAFSEPAGHGLGKRVPTASPRPASGCLITLPHTVSTAGCRAGSECAPLRRSAVSDMLGPRCSPVGNRIGSLRATTRSTIPLAGPHPPAASRLLRGYHFFAGEISAWARIRRAQFTKMPVFSCSAPRNLISQSGRRAGKQGGGGTLGLVESLSLWARGPRCEAKTRQGLKHTEIPR